MLPPGGRSRNALPIPVSKIILTICSQGRRNYVSFFSFFVRSSKAGTSQPLRVVALVLGELLLCNEGFLFNLRFVHQRCLRFAQQAGGGFSDDRDDEVGEEELPMEEELMASDEEADAEGQGGAYK